MKGGERFKKRIISSWIGCLKYKAEKIKLSMIRQVKAAIEQGQIKECENRSRYMRQT
jgi:hypothetical protein